MAKLENYNGSVQLMAGITQKGGGNFALIEANAIQTKEDGTRLDAELLSIFAQLAQLAQTVPVFIGTTAEYNTANAAGTIAIGSIVIITDDDDKNEIINTTSILGQAILGQMILG